MRCTDRRSAGQ